MKVIFDIEQYDDVPKAVTVGFFDGVHVGHRFLIDELRQVAAQKGLPCAIVTFDRHPRKTLRSDYCPQLITTQEEKIAAFEQLGVNYCYFLRFTSEMATMSAEAFIRDVLKGKIDARVLLVGYDHRFGNGRREGLGDYVRYGAENGMTVLLAASLSEGEAPPSSSAVRRELLAGNMEGAARLLGRPYRLSGRVVAGFGVGRKLGFPTANVQVDNAEKIIPPDGVYAVTVFVEKALQPYGGMLYIGKRPTLDNGENRSIEVNIFDFDKDIYGQQLTIELHKCTRGDIRFDDLPALIQQLEIDKKEVLTALSPNPIG